MSTRTLSSLGLLTALSALSGCIFVIEKDGPGTRPIDSGWDDTGWVACTEMAAASVVVSVVDPAGAPVRATSVTWSHGDTDVANQAECMDEMCSSWVAGWEVAGDITVNATLHEDTPDPCCWISDSAVQTVHVPMTADGCHVVTQSVTLVLDPSSLVCADADESGACG